MKILSENITQASRLHCSLCDEPILPGEPLSPSLFNGKHVHHECGFRAVAGGANHIRGLCQCRHLIKFGFGATEPPLPPDPPGLTKREAAREALRAWQETH